ncbi:Rieske 2Fe-2S domain-containing protein [Bradyrhizobium sp. CCBAU 45384]|uniref:Rieske 2Fe-2S domain-containing protein n=1 Tax=Bradyrhizobium sp. CCBAU 45384 TaxID=858428 RepID=UPI0023054478|nr:Rieske 2Fe-2S domain-containing protein [Bradyrhizobium sp. CCBAU 45384]MDA9409775.1 3-chlorobenzoate-3,4-dioxygenase oxygenase [Bradyrhizobium sp. CCBAU 45384]
MARTNQVDVLSHVGPGTKVGELFRSVWLPALLSAQLPKPGGAPVRLKLLGEELVAFRSGDGQVGIVQANCAHRLAPLFYGRVEEQGIRCAYHGWLYDKSGQCLDMQNESDKAVCSKVKIKFYTAVEQADVVWVYMGQDAPPELPKFPWMGLPKSQRNATVWIQESNWLQGMEGELDSSHVSILHTNPATMATSPVHQHYSASDLSPKLYAKNTAIGVLAIARRNADSKFYWRVSQFMVPAFSSIPSADFPIGGRAFIPIDDHNTYTWDFNYYEKGDLPKAFLDYVGKGLAFPPESTYQPFKLNTGTIIDTYVPVRTALNSYFINREGQSLSSPTGIHGLNDQDRAMQEGMLALEGSSGRIVDRAKEFLVAADIGIIRARRRILDVVQDEASLAKFKQTIKDGAAYAVRPLDVVSEHGELDAFLAQHDGQLTSKREAA